MDVDIPEQKEHESSSQNPQNRVVLSRNDEKWESLRGEMYRIYMTETTTLSKTRLMIEEQHGFTASRQKWKAKFKEWGGFDKHLSEMHMKIIVAKAEKRLTEEGKGTEFFHNNSRISSARIEAFKKRKNFRMSGRVSPSVETPEYIRYSTPHREENDSFPMEYLEGTRLEGRIDPRVVNRFTGGNVIELVFTEIVAETSDAGTFSTSSTERSSEIYGVTCTFNKFQGFNVKDYLRPST